MRPLPEIKSDMSAAMSRTDLPVLEELSAEAEEIGTDAAKAAAHNARGVVHRERGEYNEAMAHLRQAVDLYSQLQLRSSLAYALNNLSGVLHVTGDPEQAQRVLHQALDISTEINDLRLQALVYGSLGIQMAKTGDYPKAKDFMNRGLDVELRLGDEKAVATAWGNLGIVHYFLGDFVTALECYQRSLDLSIKHNMSWTTALATGNIGTAYVGIGDHATGADYFRRAIPLHEALGNRGSVARVTGNLGVAVRAIGDNEGAAVHFRRAVALNQELGNVDELFFVASNLIYTEVALGNIDAARAMADSLRDRNTSNPRSIAAYRAALACIYKYDGELDAAKEALTEALNLATEIGSTEQVLTMQQELRDLAQARNDFAAYIAHNAEFLRLTEEIKGRTTTSRIANMQAERAMAAEREERERERAVLYSTLPKHIADRVIRGEDVSGDHFDHAAVLFLDIVGFTSHSSQHSPAVITDLLGSIFAHFDEICTEHNVTKVKTIGDAYLCFKGDGTAEENAKAVASAAIQMQRSPFFWPIDGGLRGGLRGASPEGSPVAFRIGTHLGAVTAGIIGTQRLQYDIWGDTVNMASRQESSCEPGKIQVSEAVAEVLAGVIPSRSPEHSDGEARNVAPGTWHLALRGEIELKGKGTVTTYWLTV